MRNLILAAASWGIPVVDRSGKVLRPWSAVLLALVVRGTPGPAEAQYIPENAIVRVRMEASSPRIARVLRMSADSLWLRMDGETRTVFLPQLMKLELRERISRKGHGWIWAKRGFVLGAVVGGVTCLADQDNCRAETGERESIAEGLLGSTLFMGGGFAALGFTVGAVLPGHRWTEIHLERR